MGETTAAVAGVMGLLIGSFLRGHCRSCGTSISARCPIVELLTGALFAAAGLRFGLHPATVAYCFFFAVLVALSGIDLDHRVIPSRILYPAAGASLVLLGLASVARSDGRAFADALVGGVIGFVLLLVVHLISPRGMGFGDVRLAGFIGLNAGWLGLARVGVALFAGFLLGAVAGLVLIGAGRAGRRSALPFGPFLAAGAVVAVLAGGPVVHAWVG